MIGVGKQQNHSSFFLSPFVGGPFKGKGATSAPLVQLHRDCLSANQGLTGCVTKLAPYQDSPVSNIQQKSDMDITTKADALFALMQAHKCQKGRPKKLPPLPPSIVRGALVMHVPKLSEAAHCCSLL